MKFPTLLLIASSLVLPVQSLSAKEKDTKKPTTSKKVTKKATPKETTKKATPKETAKEKVTPKKATQTKKATPAKKETTSTKKTTPAKTTKKSTPTSTTTKKTASHVSMASPEFKKRATTWVKALPAAKKTKLLALLNKGVEADFKDFPGVGPVKVANMKKGRPFKSIEDLANINGFGEATFKAVVDHAKSMK